MLPRRVRISFGAAAWILVFAAGSPAARAIPAFPGAEGFGADTPGGRGGAIHEVTTLEDCLVPAVGCTAPVPGSLRAALQATGPRIVVFRVGGTIEIDWQIPIRDPYLTIAGQSAPGGGIAIRNASTNTLHAISIQTHDVVIRHVRFRPGRATPGTEVSDGINLANGAHHVVIDHGSLSWSVDEGLDVGWSNPSGQSAHDITVQWSIISEGLVQERSQWPPGFAIERCSDALAGGTASPCFDSKGVLAGTGGTQSVATERVSLHHNFLAHNFDRNPLVSGSGRWDLVNNVVFDPGSLMGSAVASLHDYEQARLEVNHIGNYTKRRVATLPHWSVELRLYKAAAGPGFLVWQSDTVVRDSPTGADVPGDFQCWDSAASAACAPAVFDSFKAAAPWPSSLLTPPMSALEARDTVPFSAGATRPARDAVDTCVIRHYCHQATEPDCLDFCAGNGGCPAPGGPIERPADGCGPWPDLSGGSPPPDADHDGMPDAWEASFGFDPNAGADGPLDADGDGYTNVEEFLNETHPADSDGDGAGDAVDCAPAEPGAFEVPSEVTVLRLAEDRHTLTWASAAPGAGTGTVHDVARGALTEWPVGSGDAEVCVASGVAGSSAADPSLPGTGAGFRYLVRGRNACGNGTWGHRSDGAERLTAACP